MKTGYWFGKYPEDHIKIGISRGQPRGMAAGYRLFRTLAPGSYFNSVSAEEYRTRYFIQLSELDPAKVVQDIKNLAGDRTPVLVCFEHPAKPADWCHRGFVSAWLHDTLRLEVPEYGYEQEGFGWSHPKLPATMRLPATE